jgi:DNA-binding FadR family transcriptional regulator
MRNVSLPDQIAQKLESQIAKGDLKPGSRLPTVARMALDYGVSQPVVREALTRLRSHGLIETRQGSGSSVLAPQARRGLQLGRSATWDAGALAELYAFRADIEAGSASLAALSGTASDRKALRAAIARLEHHLEDAVVGPDADLAFHMAIAKATHNRYRAKVVAYLHKEMLGAISIARGNTARTPGQSQQVHLEHVAVLRAIEAGDADAAARAMRRHITRAATRLGLPVGSRARRAPAEQSGTPD